MHVRKKNEFSQKFCLLRDLHARIIRLGGGQPCGGDGGLYIVIIQLILVGAH